MEELDGSAYLWPLVRRKGLYDIAFVYGVPSNVDMSRIQVYMYIKASTQSDLRGELGPGRATYE